MDQTPPEQIELDKKLRVLERLKDRLADREEEMMDLRSELERFEARYTIEVGRLYAEQDEIDAQIAEEELKLVPDDEEIKKRVEELRRLAEESAARAKAAEEKAQEKWEPTIEAKKAYHSIARVIHPDLALTEKDKERAHILMAELNEAYASGDQGRLNRLVAEYRVSPDVIKGDSIGDDLVRSIRQIYQIKRRFAELAEEKIKAESSELYELFKKAAVEADEGRDMLHQMSERAKTHIKKTERRLLHLRQVNKAQEDHVKEQFGMDIRDFRDPKAK